MYLLFDFELLRFDDPPFDVVESQLELNELTSAKASATVGSTTHLKFLHTLHINHNTNVSVLGSPSFFQYSGDLTCPKNVSFKSLVDDIKETHISQVGLLQPPLDDTSRWLRICSDEFATDDWRADDLRCVYNLLDTRYTQRNVHGGDTGEMEGLQGHLCTWLTNGLSTHGSDSRTWKTMGTLVYVVGVTQKQGLTRLDLRADIFCPTYVQEGKELVFCDFRLVVDDGLFRR